MGCKPYLSHTLLMILCKSMLESFSFRQWALELLPVKCSYIMADCSFSLALCTKNKCFCTIYYVLVGHENVWIQLSDTGKSMVKKNPEGHPLIIKLLLSLWLLYKNYINYYFLTIYLHPLTHNPLVILIICLVQYSHGIIWKHASETKHNDHFPYTQSQDTKLQYPSWQPTGSWCSWSSTYGANARPIWQVAG